MICPAVRNVRNFLNTWMPNVRPCMYEKWKRLFLLNTKKVGLFEQCGVMKWKDHHDLNNFKMRQVTADRESWVMCFCVKIWIGTATVRANFCLKPIILDDLVFRNYFQRCFFTKPQSSVQVWPMPKIFHDKVLRIDQY